MSDYNDESINFLLEFARKQGVACTSTTDGHLFVMKKDRLAAALENNDSDLVVIFVQKAQETKN